MFVFSWLQVLGCMWFYLVYFIFLLACSDTASLYVLLLPVTRSVGFGTLPFMRWIVLRPHILWISGGIPSPPACLSSGRGSWLLLSVRTCPHRCPGCICVPCWFFFLLVLLLCHSSWSWNWEQDLFLFIVPGLSCSLHCLCRRVLQGLGRLGLAVLPLLLSDLACTMLQILLDLAFVFFSVSSRWISLVGMIAVCPHSFLFLYSLGFLSVI